MYFRTKTKSAKNKGVFFLKRGSLSTYFQYSKLYKILKKKYINMYNEIILFIHFKRLRKFSSINIFKISEEIFVP